MRQLFWIVFLFALSMPVSMNAQTCGTTNIALGKNVVVSSEWMHRLGGGAVDGNTAGGWYTGNSNDTAYIYVDLEQSYNVCKIKLYWESDGRGKDYKLQTSTNAIDWTDIATRTNNSGMTDSFNVTGNGRYVRLYMTARVNAWVNAYQLGEIEIYNTLSNYHPSVSLTSPAANFKTFAGSNIKLTASAADIDGSISKVAFYQDTVKLGEVTAPPYEFTWVNVQAGQYALRARAYDNSNADSLSAAVNITVNPSNRWSLLGNSGTNPDSNFVGTPDNKKLVFKTNNVKRVTIQTNGFVGIGVDSSSNADVKLGVAGTIAARKLQITQASWADYVFKKNYPLMGLPELQRYISKYGHLPGLPTSKEVDKNGVEVSATLEILLRKIEELTLYTLEQNKKIKSLNNKLNRQQQQLEKLSQRKK